MYGNSLAAPLAFLALVLALIALVRPGSGSGSGSGTAARRPRHIIRFIFRWPHRHPDLERRIDQLSGRTSGRLDDLKTQQGAADRRTVRHDTEIQLLRGQLDLLLATPAPPADQVMRRYDHPPFSWLAALMAGVVGLALTVAALTSAFLLKMVVLLLVASLMALASGFLWPAVASSFRAADDQKGTH